MENKMRFIYSLSLVSLLLFFGCDQGSDILSIESDSPASTVNLISIPTPSGGLSIEADLTKYKEIDGEDGGSFTAYFNYEGGPFGEVTVVSRLYFYEDAFNGDKVISQTLDTDYAAMSFGPSMQFEARVKLDFIITGLDLTGVDPDDLDFVYVNDDGSTEQLAYDYIYMNASIGKLAIDDAELTHFSRYGFVNKEF